MFRKSSNPEKDFKREVRTERRVGARSDLLAEMDRKGGGANFREAFKLVYLDVRIMWAARNSLKSTEDDSNGDSGVRDSSEVPVEIAKLSYTEKLAMDTLQLHRRLSMGDVDDETARFFKDQNPVAASYLHIIDETKEDYPEVKDEDLEALVVWKLGTYLSNPLQD